VLLTEHHAMKAYWGSGDKAPRILHLGTIIKLTDTIPIFKFKLWLARTNFMVNTRRIIHIGFYSYITEERD
jgi:hypothetical protein